jgi:hypothetical protein
LCKAAGAETRRQSKVYRTAPTKITNSDKYTIAIAQNKCYEVLFDSEHNRVYLTIKGYWKNKEAVPHFVEDIQKVLKLTQPGFSLLSDLRTMITHPQGLKNLHLEVQALLTDAGLAKAACVEPTDRIAHLQVEDLNNKSRLHTRNFYSYTEAEAWLNALR